MGGSDWWFGRGGRAAEPKSWRAEGAAKFPGEGARSAPELARDPPPPTAWTTGGGRLRSQRLESNVIYLFAGVQPLGLDPIDTPSDFESPRPTSPAPHLPVWAAPGNTRARIPRAPSPHPDTGRGWALTRALESPPRREQGRAEGPRGGGGPSALGSHFKAHSPFQVGSDLNP